MYPTTLSSLALLISKALQARGIDSESLFHKAGLDPKALGDPNARYPVEGMQRLWALAVESTGEEGIGLAVIDYWHPTSMHALGFAWLASSTLKNALERLVRYVHMASTAANFALQETREGYVLEMSGPQREWTPIPQSIDAGAALVVHMCRVSYGDRFAPLRVTLRRPQPEHGEPFERFFQAPIAYQAEHNTLVLDKAVVLRTLPTGNTDLAHANEKVITEYLANMDLDDIVMRLKTRLIDMLPSGEVSGDAVAQAMNLSPRSLQRKLQEEGLTYSQVLEETRRELAARYIRNSRLSISEITFLLGFSEPSNFSRAFKRWNGVSPSEFRMAS